MKKSLSILLIKLVVLSSLSCAGAVKIVKPKLPEVHEAPLTNCKLNVLEVGGMDKEHRANDEYYQEKYIKLIECYDQRVDDAKNNTKRYRDLWIKWNKEVSE